MSDVKSESPDLGVSTDEQLVAAAKAGSRDACAVLLQRYYVPLRRYLTACSGDPDSAAELTQETFLTALNLLDRFVPNRPFAAWLYRIAQNHLHRLWRRRRFISLDWMLDGARLNAQIPNQSADLEADAGERDVVDQVLSELSPLLRDALLLHSLMGLTAREIAEVLGISLAAAERRISRAAEQFRIRYNATVGDALRASR